MKDFHELTRNNALIAEFMGLEKDLHPYETDVYNDRVVEYLTGTEWVPAKRLKYHKSWDWLVPVVKKVYDICDSTHGVGDWQYAIGNRMRDVYAAFNELDLIKTHSCCANFITQYNNQNQIV